MSELHTDGHGPTTNVQDRVELYKTAQDKLGKGAYGAVYKARLNELPCAAKILHPTLFETNDPAGQRIVQRFHLECELLRDIQHPNIVQYLGVTTDPDSGLPVLLMELLDESLTSFFERVPKPLPYHVQVNLSHDIALALAHLHSKGIAHRDLSSNNVLLIAGSKAKVTDFGMSKLVDVSGRVSQHSLTQVPGTQAFMPPEAFNDAPHYTDKIDCFSLGPLIIQLITAKFPEPGPRFTLVPDPRSPTGSSQWPVLEMDRRMNHISLIERSHPLLPTARQCLEYKPEDRPTAQEVCRQLAQLKTDRQYTESKELYAREENDHQSEIIRKDDEIQHLQQQLNRETSQKERLIEQLEENVAVFSEKEAQVEHLSRELDVKTTQLLIKEADYEEKVTENEELQERLVQVTITIQEQEANIENLTEQLHEKKVENETQIQHMTNQELPEIFQEPLKSPVVLEATHNVGLKWRRGTPAPDKIYYGSTAVDGSIVYFKNGRNKQIYQYNTEQETWSRVVTCPKNGFSIVLIEGILTAVGGTDSYSKDTNSLLSCIYENGYRKWVEKYPAMPTKRSNTTAVSNGHMLIALGGMADGKPLKIVELCEIPKLQWYKACDLPHVIYDPAITICGETMYLTGGKDKENKPHTGVLACSSTMLLQYATPHSIGGWFSSVTRSRQLPADQIWQHIVDLPVTQATCVTIKGDQLFAIGGECGDKKAYSKAIYRYDTERNCWEMVSEMAVARSSCLVAAVSTNKVIVAGGFTDVCTFTDIVEIGSF